MDNETAASLAVDVFIKFSGSIRCFVHTMANAVNDFFTYGAYWSLYMILVNSKTTYFNTNTKSAHILIKKQLQNGVTSDRVQYLKLETPIRWPSHLSTKQSYLGKSR